MSSQLTTDPVLDDASPGNSTFAHRIWKEDQMRGYVFGEEAVALCGYRFVPNRDPNKLPKCEACKAAMRMYSE